MSYQYLLVDSDTKNIIPYQKFVPEHLATDDNPAYSPAPVLRYSDNNNFGIKSFRQLEIVRHLYYDRIEYPSGLDELAFGYTYDDAIQLDPDKISHCYCNRDACVDLFDTLEAIVAGWPVVDQYIIAIHDKDVDRSTGDRVCIHVHIYIRFNDKTVVPTFEILNHFNLSMRHCMTAEPFLQFTNLSKIKGKWRDAVAYATHRNVPDKYQYHEHLDEMLISSNFDFNSVGDALAFKDKRLGAIYNLMATGSLTRENMYLHPDFTAADYVKYSGKIDDMFEFVERRSSTIKILVKNVNSYSTIIERTLADIESTLEMIHVLSQQMVSGLDYDTQLNLKTKIQHKDELIDKYRSKYYEYLPKLRKAISDYTSIPSVFVDEEMVIPDIESYESIFSGFHFD